MLRLALAEDSWRWIVAVVVIPAMGLLLKAIVDKRTHGLAKQGDWRGDVETMRDSWKETWQSLSDRVKRAEEGEVECEKRYEQLVKTSAEVEERTSKLEATVEELTRSVFKKNEAVQVAEMELELAERKIEQLAQQIEQIRQGGPGRDPNENGPPR